MPALDRDEYTLDQYLDGIVRRHRDLVAVTVFKRRFAFTVNDCISEHAEVWIDGAGLQTEAVESSDIPAVLEAKRMLALDDGMPGKRLVMGQYEAAAQRRSRRRNGIVIP